MCNQQNNLFIEGEERGRTMMTLRLVLNKRIRRATLVVLACSVLLTPAYAVSAERDGTVIYFTFADLNQMFFHSSSSSLRQVFPSFSWRDQREQPGQQRHIERNYRWGNGQGVDGATRPGTRPLWGY
jgi:hypothetical protein